MEEYFNKDDLKGFYSIKSGLKINNSVFEPDNISDDIMEEYKRFIILFYSNLLKNIPNNTKDLKVYTFNLSIKKKLYITIKKDKINLFTVDNRLNLITQKISPKEFERLQLIESNIMYAISNDYHIDIKNQKRDYLLSNLVIHNSNKNNTILNYELDNEISFDI